MASIDSSAVTTENDRTPRWKRYAHAPHFRTKDEEFDACKIGMWLFLTTEVLLFSGLFVAYAIFRMFYPEAFANGSHYLDWRWGTLNTVILLLSSFTIAYAIRCAQLDKQAMMRLMLLVTVVFGALFVVIKLTLEYIPKWSEGKRPGSLFDYAGAHDVYEPLWWGIYYSATGIHAAHVIIGGALILRVYLRSRKGMYGPGHYTAIEMAGLYWHLVDLIWIFLFPLLYLIH